MSDMIEIKIDAEKVMKLLGDMAKRGTNLKPVMKKIAGIMHDAVEQNFEEEGRPVKWKALAASTIKQREKKGYWPGKILQQSGRMASSIEQGYTGKSAWTGTNAKQAAIQHFGGKTGRGRKVTIPERPFMKLSKEGLKEIEETLGDYIVKGDH